MSEEIRRAAEAAISAVLEKMFFVFAEEQGEEAGPGGTPKGEAASPPDPAARWVWGEIGFQGASSGRIMLTLPYGFARTLAANFIGLEEKEISEAELLDVISELNNMISGNLFSLLNRRARYILTRPKTELISGEEKERRFPQSGMEIHLMAEGQRVELSIQILPSEGVGS